MVFIAALRSRRGRLDPIFIDWNRLESDRDASAIGANRKLKLREVTLVITLILLEYPKNSILIQGVM